MLALALQYNEGFSRAAEELRALADPHCQQGTTSEVNYRLYQAMTAATIDERIEGLRTLATHNSDLEARLFLSMELIKKYEPGHIDRANAVRLLEAILNGHPGNAAAHHYWIHAWEDTPYPETSLSFAKILPLLTPQSPHMVHMPGHVYHLSGDFVRSAVEMEKAYDADAEYLSNQV